MKPRTRAPKKWRAGFFSPYFYNAVFAVFSLFYLPVFLMKIRQSSDPQRLIKQRLGIFSLGRRQKLLNKRVIWIHAVSVGEVMAVKKFLQGFLDRFPYYHVMLTTVTPTGQKVARQLKTERVSIRYFPFDLSWSVRKFFEALHPEYLFLVETEIWPNLLIEAARRGVPVGILNARLSAKSQRRYRRILPLARPLFERLSFVLAQTEEDGARFQSLGVQPKRVFVLGNMKFDNLPVPDPRDLEALRREWGFEKDDQIFIAGSTHLGEETILKEVFARLRQEFPRLKMIVAPRHIERSEALKTMFSTPPFQAVLAYGESQLQNFDILILNKIGILKNLYQIADIVFMGGSLIKHGGQNPIEPAYFKRAMVHGPYTFNFEVVYRALDQETGAVLVRDQDELAMTLKGLLQNTNECLQLGENAFSVIHRLQGATGRHLDWMQKFLFPQAVERKNNDSPCEKLPEVFS
ncbi:MAG: 3-deoxy-D-manno-octulosonic acid transferase [Candidatus Omnitrophica bacterium]|nr:3-deoxy-D-manno-octulosonic acid transferase [Candidatus Omnitrophota bacterium]